MSVLEVTNIRSISTAAFQVRAKSLPHPARTATSADHRSSANVSPSLVDLQYQKVTRASANPPGTLLRPAHHQTHHEMAHLLRRPFQMGSRAAGLRAFSTTVRLTGPKAGRSIQMPRQAAEPSVRLALKGQGKIQSDLGILPGMRQIDLILMSWIYMNIV